VIAFPSAATARKGYAIAPVQSPAIHHVIHPGPRRELGNSWFASQVTQIRRQQFLQQVRGS